MSKHHELTKLEIGKVNRFAALCGDRTVVESDEPLLPLGWHQLFTHARDPWLQYGTDGHPHQRPCEVPVYLTKRMWASTEVRVATPIQVAGFITCERQEPVVVIKQGNSGELAFSREVLLWRRGTQVLLEETKTIVYKEAEDTILQAKAHLPQQAMPEPELSRALMLDEVALFKYSALLEVAHRIHFDQPYATQVEGYPSLVIHGPLLIQLLLNLARNNLGGGFSGTYTARAIRPSYLGAPLKLNLAQRSDHTLLWVSEADGQPTLLITLNP